MSRAHYDGYADWYDLEFDPAPLEGDQHDTVTRLLGDGPGVIAEGLPDSEYPYMVAARWRR